jgi:prefoldin subunit 5
MSNAEAIEYITNRIAEIDEQIKDLHETRKALEEGRENLKNKNQLELFENS